MKTLARLALILFLATALTFTGAGFALATVVVRSGVMTVSVKDHSTDGVSLYLPIPAALIELGAASLPLVMPAEDLARMRRQLQPIAGPLKALSAELVRCPDAVLVKVDSKREQVEIKKDGSSLKITVHSNDADVRVSLPADALYRLLGSLTL